MPRSDPESTPSDAARRAWQLERPALGLALGGVQGVAGHRERLAWAHRAEALGLHSVWLPEMHFAPGVCPAPLVELASLAGATTELRLGTTSLLLPLHPPERIAAEITALDRLSGGRLLIGLGRGFQRRMLEAFGVDPAEKRDRFDEALERIFSAWAAADARGRRPGPSARPHPPLAVAAFGPKGLAQAARHGLPYLASPVETTSQIEQNQRLHRAALAPDSAPPLSLVMRTVFVGSDPDVLARARAALEAETDGRRAALPTAVERALARPLDERAILGPPDFVREALLALRARLGIDLLIVRPQIAGLETADQMRSLECLAREIWPEVVSRDPTRPA
ncbi:MAG: LLM class flavin-dependent oxidoreductase [Myxococcota bacterium]